MTKRSKKVAYVLSNEIKWNSQSLAYLFLFGVCNIDEENSILISENIIFSSLRHFLFKRLMLRE